MVSVIVKPITIAQIIVSFFNGALAFACQHSPAIQPICMICLVLVSSVVYQMEMDLAMP